MTLGADRRLVVWRTRTTRRVVSRRSEVNGMRTTQAKRVAVWIGVAVIVALIVVGIIVLASVGDGTGGGNLPGY